MSQKLKIISCCMVIILAGLAWPQHFTNPVSGAKKNDYNPRSFWYYPWGRSVTHKGVDIFAREGTEVRAATSGLVIFKGELAMGGNVVMVLGPKWRIHYYAHLQRIDTDVFSVVNRSEKIGTVGTSGNAQGKSPHLHYTIVTLLPYVWKVDKDRQGWKKMFYLNPIPYLEKS